MRTAEHLHHVTHEGWAKQILGLVAFLLLCYLAAYLGQLATMPNIGTWYAELAKPAFNPPSWVFGPVWSVLYTLMGIAAWLVWRFMTLIEGETMTTINLPKNLVYGAVCIGFVLMFLRSVQVFVANQRRGYSVLERPEEFQTSEEI